MTPRKRTNREGNRRFVSIETESRCMVVPADGKVTITFHQGGDSGSVSALPLPPFSFPPVAQPICFTEALAMKGKLVSVVATDFRGRVAAFRDVLDLVYQHKTCGAMVEFAHRDGAYRLNNVAKMSVMEEEIPPSVPITNTSEKGAE